MLSRVYTVEIVCESSSFSDMSVELMLVLTRLASQLAQRDVDLGTTTELCDSEGRPCGYAMLHSI